ncbi:hypothetical protein EPK57_04685, partial [Salmonella enterica subsp. arizonae serovar 48:z4,z24:-]|nr:hypothetical protein [Salmonella enterica subsp. arizonae serovar 48:z4,z24:-]
SNFFITNYLFDYVNSNIRYESYFVFVLGLSIIKIGSYQPFRGMCQIKMRLIQISDGQRKPGTVAG